MPKHNVLRSFLSVRAPMWALCISVVFLLVVVLGQTPNRVQAATSGTVNFQARLMTAAGNTVADGDYNVEFKLYDALSSSGSSQGSCTGDVNCLWTETRVTSNKVRVVNGYLTVNLGSVNAFPTTINWDQELWLSMNVGDTGSANWDGEMTPRLKLTAVPYAFRAGLLVTQSGANKSTLSFAAPTDGRSITIPDESGTICMRESTACNFAPSTGSTSYIHNQSVGNQTADFRISGTGRANTALQSPAFRPVTDGTTAISIQNAGGSATALTVDTTNSRVGIGGSFTPQQALDVIGSVQVRDAASATKSYRLRTSGADLDLESAGKKLYISNWENADYTGEQRTYIVLENDANMVQAIGGWHFRTAADGTTRHIIDGSVGTSVKFNETGESTDFSVQGESDANLLFVDGSADRIGIGTNAPGYKLEVTGTLGVSSNVTVSGTYNTNTFTSSSLQFGAAGTATVQSASGQALTITGHAASTWSTDSGALTVQGASGLSLKAASGNIVLGTSDTSATLLVLDVKTDSGDPGSTIEGSMYYNDNSNRFRCYQENAWTNCIGSSGSTTLQGAYDGSTGSTTPEIKLDSTRGGLDIQDANSTLGTSTPLFTVRGSNGSGLGTELFTVTGNGNVGIGAAAPSRPLHISINNSTSTAPPLLIEQSGSGDSSIEFKTSTRNFYAGIDNSDGKFKISSSTAASVSFIEDSNTVQSGSDNNTDGISSHQVSVGATGGSVSSISVNIKSVDGGNPGVQVAIYSDVGGEPSALLGSSSTQTASLGWNTFPIASVTVNPSTNYWLAVNTQGNTTWAASDAAGNSRYQLGTPFGTWPSTFSVTNTDDWAISLYMTIVPSGSPDSFAAGSLMQMSDTGATVFRNSTDSTAAFQVQNSAGNAFFNIDTANSKLSVLDSSGNSLFEIKDVTTADNNFGAIVTSGAFIDNTSYFGDEFNTEKNTTALTADQVCVRSGTVNMLCPGDNEQFYFDTTSTTATYSTPADTVNGIARLQFGTTTAVGAFIGNGLTQNNLHAMFLKANLPVVQMKLRTNIVNANNDIVWGLMDQATAPTAQNTLPSNGIFFWPNNGSSWVGVVRSGGSNVGTVTCTGSISTSQFAVGRIEVVGASSVRFLMDYDASNGISFTDCGTVSGANPTAAMGVAVYNIHNEATGSRNIDIDYIRVWQDDAATDAVDSHALQGGQGTDSTGLQSIAISQPYDATDNGDLGEYYPVEDSSSFESGDLVAVDEGGGSKVRKTKEAYDNKVVGVISTSSAQTIGQVGTEGQTVRVAFTGRAPVKVSKENGVIQPGDLLTASSQPGVAMKATGEGAVIGQALDGYADDGVGRVVARLNVTGHRISVDGALQNGNFDQLSLANVTISGSLYVAGNAIFNGSVTIQSLEVKGHLKVGSDTAGTLLIPAGHTSAPVRFGKPYEEIPIVTTSTPEFVLTKVFNKTVNGFTVGIQSSIGHDLYVDWTAIEPQSSN